MRAKVKRMIFLLLTALLLFGQTALTASAKLVSRVVPEEAEEFGGHYYMLYDDVGGFDGSSWDKAEKFCRKRGGYLVSITSKAENDFLTEYITKSGIDGAYIGLHYDGGWKWSSGEKYGYTSWKKNGPAGESEKPFGILGGSGRWKNGTYGSSGTAYICEWDGGGRISEAEVDDAKRFIKEKTAVRLGDSYYRVFNYPLDRSEAARLCVNMGGHLADIGSKEEQRFITDLIAGSGKRNMYWIGAHMEGGKWLWTDGAPVDGGYTTWTEKKLNNFAGDAQYAVINTGSSKYDRNSWVAEALSGETKSDTEAENCINYGFVCEWELVCSYDGGRSIAHTDGEWVIDRESTCTKAGQRSLYCAKCGEIVRSEELPLEAHHFERVGLIGKLRIAGVKKIECVNCGESRTKLQWGSIWVIPAAVIFYIVFVQSYNAARDDFEAEAAQKHMTVVTKRIPMKLFVIVPTVTVTVLCLFLMII